MFWTILSDRSISVGGCVYNSRLWPHSLQPSICPASHRVPSLLTMPLICVKYRRKRLDIESYFSKQKWRYMRHEQTLCWHKKRMCHPPPGRCHPSERCQGGTRSFQMVLSHRIFFPTPRLRRFDFVGNIMNFFQRKSVVCPLRLQPSSAHTSPNWLLICGVSFLKTMCCADSQSFTDWGTTRLHCKIPPRDLDIIYNFHPKRSSYYIYLSDLFPAYSHWLHRWLIWRYLSVEREDVVIEQVGILLWSLVLCISFIDYLWYVILGHIKVCPRVVWVPSYAKIVSRHQCGPMMCAVDPCIPFHCANILHALSAIQPKYLKFIVSVTRFA